MTDVTDIPHLSRTSPPAPEALSIRPIPALQDNYIWCIGRGRDFIVVDPGEAQPVLDALAPAPATALRTDGLLLPQAVTSPAQAVATPAQADVARVPADAAPSQTDTMPARLLAILITHHHHDHVGGIAGLLAQWPDARVIGPVDCIPLGVKEAVNGGDTLHFPGLDLDMQVMATPGHTRDHLSYFCPPLPGHPHPALFCGDTMFSAGCGRVFDGTVEQLYQSLQQLRTLPPDTRICAAHEYTLTNLHFALGAEPGNDAIRERLAHCRRLRENGLPTLPSTLSGELQVNPFLRSHLPALSRHLPAELQPETADAFGVFAALRRWRNSFKPPATP